MTKAEELESRLGRMRDELEKSKLNLSSMTVDQREINVLLNALACLQVKPEITSNPDYTPPPPLGVMPKWVWLEKRAKHLAEAISRYLAEPTGDRVTYATRWSVELYDVMQEAKKERKYMKELEDK